MWKSEWVWHKDFYFSPPKRRLKCKAFIYCTSICLVWSQLPCCTRKTSNILSKDLNWDITAAFLIYSLISSPLRERHDSASLALNCPAFFLSPRAHFHSFNPSAHNLYFSHFLTASTFLAVPHSTASQTQWMLPSGDRLELHHHLTMGKSRRRSYGNIASDT